MARKVLLSFLGNSVYKQCHYTTTNFQSTQVRFFQEALVQLLCPQWTTKDHIYIFLTPAANKNNWEGHFYQGQGLKQILSQYPHISVTAIKEMSSGLSETEIWQLFEKIYECLQPNDEVYLDITHGFRTLPMLLTVLLDYAKALKQIQVKKICYGALETLGNIRELETKYPHPSDRKVPILDLTSFSTLQDWTAAAADFKNYGKIQQLGHLTNNSLLPTVNNQHTTATTTQALQQLHQHIHSLVPLFQTNRGKALQGYPFQELHQLLAQLLQQPNIIKPLYAVIQEMQDKIQHFQSDDPLTWLKATKWCKEHGLIQQGITQLREGFITWLCQRFQQTIDADFFVETQSSPRVLISNVFTIYHNQIPKSKWQKKNKDNTSITRALLADPMIQQIAASFIQLGKLRHDINHGGYQHSLEPPVFYEQLEEIILAIEVVILNE